MKMILTLSVVQKNTSMLATFIYTYTSRKIHDIISGKFYILIPVLLHIDAGSEQSV